MKYRLGENGHSLRDKAKFITKGISTYIQRNKKAFFPKFYN